MKKSSKLLILENVYNTFNTFSSLLSLSSIILLSIASLDFPNINSENVLSNSFTIFLYGGLFKSTTSELVKPIFSFTLSIRFVCSLSKNIENILGLSIEPTTLKGFTNKINTVNNNIKSTTLPVLILRNNLSL